MNYRILFLFVFLSASIAQAQVPVMLHLSRSMQSDTLVTNFPAELTALVQPLILKGEITLWNSPKKQIKISPAGLRDLEIQAEMDFASATDIFIYETWKINNKTNKIDIAGISFTAKNPKGNEVHFGFVEYQNLLPHLKTNISVNVNATYVTLYEDVFLNKWYDFTVVQYGETTIENLEQSNRIININILGKKLANARHLPLVKRVKYEVVKAPVPNEKLEKNTQQLIFNFEKFFSENFEVLLNFGADKIENIDSQNFYISKIEFDELWAKNDHDKIQYMPINFIIYVNDVALDYIPFITYKSWNLKINEKPLEEFLSEKKFIFTINKINNQNISKNEAGLYEKALYNHDWNRLSAYVKNF